MLPGLSLGFDGAFCVIVQDMIALHWGSWSSLLLQMVMRCCCDRPCSGIPGNSKLHGLRLGALQGAKKISHSVSFRAPLGRLARRQKILHSVSFLIALMYFGAPCEAPKRARDGS